MKCNSLIVVVLEHDPDGIDIINSQLDHLNEIEIIYARSIPRAMSVIGLRDVDYLLIDERERLYPLESLMDFADRCNVEYQLFTTNGRSITDYESVRTLPEVNTIINDKLNAIHLQTA